MNSTMSRRWAWGRTWLALILILVLALAGSTGARQASAAPPPLQPFPCPDMPWRLGSPAFTALPGAQAYYGQYAGGLYRVEVPDKWNGELVLYAHGYVAQTGPTGDLLQVPSIQPGWRANMIQQGFAWAASSYRCNGYVPGIGLQDTLLLTGVFQDMNGGQAAKKTYLTGHSMGGHVTLLGMHEYPATFAGALAMCPAAPVLFDYFTAMGAAAEVVTGLTFSSSTPATDTLVRMFGIMGTPPNYTAKGYQMASIMINSSGGPRPFAFEGLATWFTSTISGSKLAGATDPRTAAMTNQDWGYGIDAGLGLTRDQVTSQVRRLAADPANRGEDTPYNEVKPLNGKIQRPLLTMHGTGDMYVPIFVERQLKTAVEAAGKSDLLVQRIYRIPAHCGFSDAETNRAFDDMVAWARGGSKPAGDDVMADLSDAGKQFTNPLRPGDPGTARITPALVGARPPLPPNTGNGSVSATDDTESWPFAAGAGAVLLVGTGWVAVDVRRRRARTR